MAAIRRGAYEVTLAHVGREEPKEAREWLLIRDFRQATRFTRPGVDATTAIDGLESGELTPEEATTQIQKDLLDAYQSRLLEYLDEAATESERGYEPAVAESLAIAAGYWGMLAPEYQEQRGAEAREEADAHLRLAPHPRRRPQARTGRGRRTPTRALNHFTAAPFTAEEQARRAQQLIRFIDLIPVEYDHGVSGTEVTTPFEIIEAIAFSMPPNRHSAISRRSSSELDPEELAKLEERGRASRRLPRRRQRGRRRSCRWRDRGAPTTARRHHRGDLPRAVEGVERRGRLRPDSDQPRPDGGRGLAPASRRPPSRPG